MIWETDSSLQYINSESCNLPVSERQNVWELQLLNNTRLKKMEVGLYQSLDIDRAWKVLLSALP